MEPKFEKEIMAMRGSRLKRFAVSAVSAAISASCSASGSMFTVVSARRTTRFLNISRYAPETCFTPGRVFTICRAGRMTSGYS